MYLKQILTITFAIFAIAGSASAFTGTVTDENGNGLAGAKITLIANSAVTVAYSGTDGSYSLPDLAANTNYQIRVTLNGYPAQSASGNSDSYEEVDFEFEAADATLAGRIMQPDGTPIAFAVINAGSLGNYVSDSNGDFSISAPIGAQYSLQISAADMFFPAAAAGTLSGNTTRVIVGDFD